MFCAFSKAQNTLVVNEIQVANIDQYIDNSYNYGGWIELYNPTNNNIDISYWYISDDPAIPTKARLSYSIGAVPAKGYKVLWFDHHSADGQYGPYASKQIRLKMDADGGSIYLYDRNKQIVLSQDYPSAISRCSYARVTDGDTSWNWSGMPTPGKSNNSMTFSNYKLASPEPSISSGIISAPTSFTVNCPIGSKLIYTTDGSTPTLTNGTVSNNYSFNVDKTSVWRFRVFQNGSLPSEVITRSFIFKDQNYTLPIISVVTNPDNLYDDSIGVYTVGVNGATGRGLGYKSNINMDWERPVNFEYFTSDGTPKVNQEVTFYISGGWSRHWAPSSFKLKAEKQYQLKNSIDYPFFGNKPFIKNKTLLMRNGGNDTSSRAKDALVQHIIHSSGLYVDGQDWNPCHVFLNGKYLAMLNMREPSNKFFGYSNYGIDTDEMDAFELGEGGFVMQAGDINAYNEWYSLSNLATSETSYSRIKELVEIDEYINYMATEFYLGQWDWLNNSNNIKGFRSRNNGKYHFVLFDLDSAFDYPNMLSMLNGSTKNSPIVIFNKMTKNESFKRQFINAYCLVDGSVFTDERVKTSADYVGNILSTPLILEGKSPWGTCDYIKNVVPSHRNERIADLRSYFSLGNGSQMIVGATCGEANIMLDNQPIPTNRFKGTLFAPFTLTASAPAGYNFVGWKKGVQQTVTLLNRKSTWSYYDKGSLDGENWKTYDVSAWSSGKAPLGFSKTDIATTLDYGNDANKKRPTYYFRTNVNLNDLPANNDIFTLNFTVDDGFVIYVNGKEAYRQRMPEGTPLFETYAASFSSGNPDVGSIVLNSNLFVKGDNIIAVEVHNTTGNSSDIYWDAEIIQSSNIGTKLVTERAITFTNDEDCSLTAVFEPISNECRIAAGSTPVVINEVSAGNSIFVNEYFKKNDWIELYNTTSEPVDVAGMYLSDDPSIPEKYCIPSATAERNTVIPANGYLIVWADNISPITQLHSNFKLSNTNDQCVILTAVDKTWSDKLTYVLHNGDESVGRYPDGGKRTYLMTKPTINKSNFIGTYSQWLSGVDENFDEEAYLTGIEKPLQDNKVVDTNIYDLQGRRMSTDNLESQPKGIYIINGKKVIIR